MANAIQMEVKIKVTAEMLSLALETLRAINGVDDVERVSDEQLHIIYDVNQTRWLALRDQLQAVGAYNKSGRFARWRDRLRDFKEQNVRDNMKHRPACCSKPPTGAGHR